MIARMHHAAWRCRDAEEARAFPEDFLGLPLAAAMPVESEMHGRPVRALRLFFRLGDGAAA